jgi:hypothetical protein
VDGGTRIEGSTDQGLAYGGKIVPVTNRPSASRPRLKRRGKRSPTIEKSRTVIPPRKKRIPIVRSDRGISFGQIYISGLNTNFPLEQAYRHSTSSPPDLPATGRLPWTPLRPLVCQRLSAPPNRQLLDVRNVNIRGTTLSEQTLIIQSPTYIQLAREEGWSGVRRDAMAPSTHVVLPHKAVAI